MRGDPVNFLFKGFLKSFIMVKKVDHTSIHSQGFKVFYVTCTISYDS